MKNNHSLGFYTLTGLVIANMIGAGVFTTSGFALGDLGSPSLVLLAWLVGGGLAVCGALSYGALIRLMPESGGEYLFLSRSIHPLLGFIAGWVSLLAGFTGAIAYAAKTFESYLLPPVYQGLLPENGLATLVILLAALMHGVRLNVGTLAQNITVVLKLSLIAVFILLAVIAAPWDGWQGVSHVEGAQQEFSIYTFALSLMWISFSYSGFNAAVYIAGEVKVGARVIPRAMVFGTFITMLIYIVLNAVFVLIPPGSSIVFQQDVAAITAQYIAGDAFSLFIRVVIAIALFTSVSAMIMVGPRVYAKMAEDGLMPNILAFRGTVPSSAIVMQSLLAILVVWIGTLRELLSYLGFTLGLSAAMTVAALFVVVKKDRELAKSLPGYPWAPITYVLFTALFACFAAIREPNEMLAAILTFVTGGAVFYMAKKCIR